VQYLKYIRDNQIAGLKAQMQDYNTRQITKADAAKAKIGSLSIYQTESSNATSYF
jgi:hypothetical protein